MTRTVTLDIPCDAPDPSALARAAAEVARWHAMGAHLHTCHTYAHHEAPGWAFRARPVWSHGEHAPTVHVAARRVTV